MPAMAPATTALFILSPRETALKKMLENINVEKATATNPLPNILFSQIDEPIIKSEKEQPL